MEKDTVDLSNRELATALVNKYAPSYRVAFRFLSHGEIVREQKGFTDAENRIIYLDSALIDHASALATTIFVAHELGHALAQEYRHGPNWRRAVEHILIMEGLVQYADPKYYRRTAPAALWKLHIQHEAKKGQPQWLKF